MNMMDRMLVPFVHAIVERKLGDETPGAPPDEQRVSWISVFVAKLAGPAGDALRALPFGIDLFELPSHMRYSYDAARLHQWGIQTVPPEVDGKKHAAPEGGMAGSGPVIPRAMAEDFVKRGLSRYYPGRGEDMITSPHISRVCMYTTEQLATSEAAMQHTDIRALVAAMRSIADDVGDPTRVRLTALVEDQDAERPLLLFRWPSKIVQG